MLNSNNTEFRTFEKIETGIDKGRSLGLINLLSLQLTNQPILQIMMKIECQGNPVHHIRAMLGPNIISGPREVP